MSAAMTEPTTPEPGPQAIAEAVRDAMWASDRASRMMGMAVTEVAPGRATLTMTVRADMLNGHGSCHGGLISTLADSAFAFACNSHNELSVASGFQVSLVAPAREGDLLTATCTEQHKAGRTGVYDCEVSNQRGERIALFRGQSYTAKGRAVVDTMPLPAARRTV